MQKLVSLNNLLKIAEQLKAQKKNIVWTNGCFDILHAGHVDCLERAKNYGDILVVGLNSDESIRLLKGFHRPLCNQEQRARVLSGLTAVDFIVLFKEPSPIKIIKKMQPDFFVKGGDYTIDSMDQEERQAIENYGGKIVFLPELKGISTSSIIERILKFSGRLTFCNCFPFHI